MLVRAVAAFFLLGAVMHGIQQVRRRADFLYSVQEVKRPTGNSAALKKSWTVYKTYLSNVLPAIQLWTVYTAPAKASTDFVYSVHEVKRPTGNSTALKKSWTVYTTLSNVPPSIQPWTVYKG